MAYSECKTSSRSIYGSAQLSRVSFVLSQKGVIYIDMLDFVDHMAFQSRDKIVPPFTTKWKDQRSLGNKHIAGVNRNQPTFPKLSMHLKF